MLKGDKYSKGRSLQDKIMYFDNFNTYIKHTRCKWIRPNHRNKRISYEMNREVLGLKLNLFLRTGSIGYSHLYHKYVQVNRNRKRPHQNENHWLSICTNMSMFANISSQFIEGGLWLAYS